MNKFYLGVRISDIHFGASDPKVLYSELKNEFLNPISKFPRLDFIFVAGDLFHEVLSLSSISSKYASRFIDDLVRISHKKGSKIRIIKGTNSHDSSQLDNFLHYQEYEDIDFRIINTVCEENLFKDLKILYVPEEYMKSKEEYYKEYFSKRNYYDMILGHGMMEDVSFISQESEVQMKSAPIFTAKEFDRICKGPVLLGHIHKPMCLRGFIYYSSSFTRWCQGEDEPRGFDVVGYFPKTNEFMVNFVENKMARKYITIDMGNIFNESSVEDVVKFIERQKDVNNIYKLRIFINNDGSESCISKIMILKDYFKQNPDISIVDNNTALIAMENRGQEIIDEYNYIFDKGITIEEKIQKFINANYNKEISIDRIRNILFDDNKDRFKFDGDE